MKIFVEGIEIELTPDQILHVEKEKKKMNRAANRFINTLKYFGFRKYPDLPNSYGHKQNSWYAEILNAGQLNAYVWMVGNGLKETQGFPGGYVYWEPHEIKDEIIRFRQGQST